MYVHTHVYVYVRMWTTALPSPITLTVQCMHWVTDSENCTTMVQAYEDHVRECVRTGIRLTLSEDRDIHCVTMQHSHSFHVYTGTQHFVA